MDGVCPNVCDTERHALPPCFSTVLYTSSACRLYKCTKTKGDGGNPDLAGRKAKKQECNATKQRRKIERVIGQRWRGRRGRRVGARERRWIDRYRTIQWRKRLRTKHDRVASRVETLGTEGKRGVRRSIIGQCSLLFRRSSILFVLCSLLFRILAV